MGERGKQDSGIEWRIVKRFRELWDSTGDCGDRLLWDRMY